MGDTVFVTPVLRRLRDNFPDAVLDFAASNKSVPLMKDVPLVDDVFPIPADYSVASHSRFFLGLRKRRYDVVVIQEVNSHYAAMATLTGGKFLVGFQNSLGFLLDYFVPRPHGVHAALAELETVNGWTTQMTPPATELAVSNEEMMLGRDILASSGIESFANLVCIHPACSSPNSDKDWKVEYFAEVADLLIRDLKVDIIFEGIGSEREMIDTIRSKMKFPAVTLAGKTNLRQVLGVLKACRLVIGPDTGTMHLANAVGTPVVMLFGRTDPIDTGPFDCTGRSKFVRVDLPCIGCVHRTPVPDQWEICKNIRPVYCMEQLFPQIVYDAAVEALTGQTRPDTFESKRRGAHQAE